MVRGLEFRVRASATSGSCSREPKDDEAVAVILLQE